MKLDTYRLAEISASVADQIEELEHSIFELAGEEFTIGSPQQLGRVLFEVLGLTPAIATAKTLARLIHAHGRDSLAGMV